MNEEETLNRQTKCTDHFKDRPMHVVCCGPHDGSRALCGAICHGNMAHSDAPTTCKRCAELEDSGQCPDFGRCLYV